MDAKTLSLLEQLNQLRLTDAEREDMLRYFELQATELEKLNAVDTAAIERMVQVAPMTNVIREDIAVKKFERDALQAQAPEQMDGYWQVPRLVE